MKKLLLLLSIVLFIFSCRKDSFITSKDALVRFSSDTLFFDTVFTTAGSITQYVKIVNSNNQKLRLTNVALMGGATSPFSINIDGQAGPDRSGLELDAGDSLYIFVALRANATSSTSPFILQDSIAVSFNGKQQFIQLQAYGQNAHFLRNVVLTGNVVWDASLPYVVLGGLEVAPGASLTIGAGTRVYFHADAPLLVDGSLVVNGDHFDSTRVYFQGDRLDYPYSNFPGSWPGIYFRETSTNNHLSYAVLKNAYQAVVAIGGASGGSASVVLNQCVIDNSYDAGILGLSGIIEANNCLISNCGSNVRLSGGNYSFTHCTVAAFSNNYVSHTKPVLSLADSNGVQASFVNCIFWGNNGTVDNEVSVSRSSSGTFNVGFVNCLWKVKTAPSGISSSGMISNADPLFDSVNTVRNYYDFHLRAGSPVIDKGVTTSLTIDLDGRARSVGAAPDPGAYERQ